ncbi:MAG TPA: DMT family transporter [Anaerovoracaceae bacterium]|nr:DMT family transporter [Anaerovoracaceae bacterium]
MTNDKDKKKELIAVIGLFLAALCWGISYPLTKYVEACPTFYIIAIRFFVAAAVLAIAFWKSFKDINKEVIKSAFILSFIISSMYIFNIWGIKYTTSVKASFFTCLSFLIVPVINYFAYKLKISKIIVISALICLVGMFLLCYAPGMGGLMINIGDILCFIASIAGSVNIIYIEKVSKNSNINSTLFTILLMAFVSLWGIIIALFRGEMDYTCTQPELISIIVMGLFCSAAAFMLQTRFEALVPSNRVGVIFALEPASGCILSVLLLKETMVLTGWIGTAVIMASILYMEVANNRIEAKKLAAAQRIS